MIMKSIGGVGPKGDCIQPEPIISRPGTKGEPGPSGLPGNRIDFWVMFVQVFAFDSKVYLDFKAHQVS